MLLPFARQIQDKHGDKNEQNQFRNANFAHLAWCLLFDDDGEPVGDLVVGVLDLDDVELQRLDQLDKVIRSPDGPMVVIVGVVA